MTDPSAAGRAILGTVHASLKLARNSSELLTISQLLAMEGNICATLAVVSDQIQVKRSSGLDASDWDNASDEEKEDAGGASSNPPDVSRTSRRSRAEFAGSEGGNGPRLSVPGPYPINPPRMASLPDHWYVVSRGMEVGIFTDVHAAANAVTSVTRHQVRVKTWLEAVTLYNELYRQRKIVRVHG